MKKLFLIDFILQTLVLLPMLACDILGIIGISSGSAMAEYLIYGLFLTTPVGIAQVVSALIWVIKGNTFHKIYLPIALVVAAFVVYVMMGGQGIPSSLFWILIFASKGIAVVYWFLTFYFYRRIPA